LESDVIEGRAGSFVSLEDRLIYTSAADSFGTRATRPNHNGSFLVEFSPIKRLTVSNHTENRNYHIAGSAILSSTFFNVRSLAGPSGPVAQEDVTRILDSRMEYDRVRNQAEVEFDIGMGFVARGGYRYTSIETVLEEGGNEGSGSSASFSHHTAIAGVQYRRARWMDLSFDYENNNPDSQLTRTDLFDYDKFDFSWRVGSWNDFSAHGRVSVLRNSNDAAEIDLSAHNRNYSFAVDYEPSERLRVSLDYARSNIYSDLAILLPQTLQVDRSLFDERTNAVGAGLGIGIVRGTRLDFGYRGIFNVGSFPLNYHQPYASLSIPLERGFVFKTYWQWYGYNEKAVSLQDYRGHLVTLSLAYAY